MIPDFGVEHGRAAPTHPRPFLPPGDTTVKYMLTMQGTAKGWESMSTWKPEELQAHIRFMMDLYAELSAAGELVLAEGLDVPAHARVVKATQADAPIVSDGPFAETKEFLAGFWI